MRTAIAMLAVFLGIDTVTGQIRPAPTPKPPPAAASGHAATAHKRPAPVNRTADGTAPGDSVLEARIREKLSRSKLGADPIRVTVHGGVAVFEGETAVIQRKGAATRIARSAGAVRVDNRIRLSEEARRQAAANLAKGRRRAQVVRGLPRDQR